MEIKAADVMKLRHATNAGMMDCKKALQEAEGDFDKAVEIVLFLLEEIGSMLHGIKDSRLNDSKGILSLSRDADAVLLSLLDNKEAPTNLKEIVETERQSLAIRFPLLPIEI